VVISRPENVEYSSSFLSTWITAYAYASPCPSFHGMIFVVDPFWWEIGSSNVQDLEKKKEKMAFVRIPTVPGRR
jgi:hypothetical protein